MLNLRLEEIAVTLCFTLLHLGIYQHYSHLPLKKIAAKPILIEFIHPKPKPVPIVEEPKPKLIDAPLKPKEPPKEQKPKQVKPKKPVVKKTELRKVVEKPRLQQESIIKVHAEEVVEKEVVEHAQPLSEPVIKKPDNKPEEKAEPIEPPHEAVVRDAKYEGSTQGVYPPEAKEQGIEGLVKIKIQVLENGCMGNATIVKSSGSDILDSVALENISKCDFQPKTKDGVPVKSTVVLPIRFRLD